MTPAPEFWKHQIRPSPWCEVDGSYLRKLQIKSDKYDRICELLKDALNAEFRKISE